MADMDAIEKRLEEATLGPWTSSREDMDSFVDGISVAYIYRDPEERIQVIGGNFRTDSRFIAHAPSDISFLLA